MRRRARIRSPRFAFAGLRAARRWRRARGGIARSRAAWMPLALRWRRARSALRAVSPRDRASPRAPTGALREPAAAHPAGAGRLVRERLAFATLAREIRSRSRERERFALTSTWRETHSLARSEPRRDRPGVRAWRARAEMRGQHAPRPSADPRGEMTRAFQRRAAETVFHPSRFGVARDLAPATSSREPRPAYAFRGASFGVTRRGVADAAPAPRAPAAAIEALQRTAPLVWRQSGPRADALPTLARAPAPAMHESVVPHAASAMRDATPARAPVAAAPAPAMPRLDAAFVDRLAEDVIRRVDRRARIERERRGG